MTPRKFKNTATGLIEIADSEVAIKVLESSNIHIEVTDTKANKPVKESKEEKKD